jgi:predicted cupin superfamily sugar epimerase
MKDAAFWINHLQLIKHPTAGYYRIAYESSETLFNKENQLRFAHSSIYYLLEGHEIGYWRCLKSDETFHFYNGSDLIIHMIDNGGAITKVKVGNLSEDQTALLQFTIPANTWFALEVAHKNNYSLVACSVTPGFDGSDYQILDKHVMLNTFPQYADVIQQFCSPGLL